VTNSPVEIGTKQHNHFQGTVSTVTRSIAVLAAAKDAAAFVYDVTMDRSVFMLTTCMSVASGSSHFLS